MLSRLFESALRLAPAPEREPEKRRDPTLVTSPVFHHTIASGTHFEQTLRTATAIRRASFAKGPLV